jgi:hypothetical protein
MLEPLDYEPNVLPLHHGADRSKVAQLRACPQAQFLEHKNIPFPPQKGTFFDSLFRGPKEPGRQKRSIAFGMVQANVGHRVTSSLLSVPFFVPFSTYHELVTSRDHNTKHKQLINTATMVMEPPGLPAAWIR